MPDLTDLFRRWMPTLFGPPMPPAAPSVPTAPSWLTPATHEAEMTRLRGETGELEELLRLAQSPLPRPTLPEAPLSFEDRQARQTSESEAFRADLRALDERLGQGSAALSRPTTPPFDWEGAIRAWEFQPPSSYAALKHMATVPKREPEWYGPLAGFGEAVREKALAALQPFEDPKVKFIRAMEPANLPIISPENPVNRAFRWLQQRAQELPTPVELTAGTIGGAATFAEAATRLDPRTNPMLPYSPIRLMGETQPGENELLKALGQLAMGGMEAATPFIGAQLLRAPLATIRMLGTFGVSDSVIQSLAERVGVGQEARTILGLVGGAAVTHGVGKLGPRPAPPVDSPEAIAANLREHFRVMDELGVKTPRPPKYRRLLPGAVEPEGPPPGVIDAEFYEAPALRGLLRGTVEPPAPPPAPPPVEVPPLPPEAFVFESPTTRGGVVQPPLETLTELETLFREPVRPPPRAAAPPGMAEVPVVAPGAPLAGAVAPSRPVEVPAAAPTPPVQRPAVPGAARAVERPISGAPSDIVEIADPSVIGIDAARFQFKESDARGVTGRLRGVEWDPDAPAITVYEPLDGSLWVTDGFQRLNRYLELQRQGRTLPPLRARVKREADGFTESDVRRGAAMRNLQEGSAQPVDVAKLLREGPLAPEERARIPRTELAGAQLAHGENLAKLGDDAFQMVVNGEVRQDHAAFVGKHFDDPTQQVYALRALARAGAANQTQAEAFVVALRDGLLERAAKRAQGELPGMEVEYESLAGVAAKLVDDTGKLLRSRRAAFTSALRNAPKLEEAGNILVREKNVQIREETQQLLAYYDRYAQQSGTLTRQAINTAARDIHAGTLSVADAPERILNALRADIESQGRGGGAGAAPIAPRPGEPPGPRPDERLAGRPARVPPAEEPHPPAVAPTAAPEEARAILEELDRTMRRANEPVPEAFGLRPQELPAPGPRELERQYGQRNILEAATREATARAPSPLEEVLRPAEVDLRAERAEVRQAVQPAEARMREVTTRLRPRRLEDLTPAERTSLDDARAAYLRRADELGMRAEVDRGLAGMDRSAVDALDRGGLDYARGVWEKGLARLQTRRQPVAAGQVPWTEHDLGGFVAPPGKDFAAIRLNEGQTHLSKQLAAAGWSFRSKWGQWFKNVTDATRDTVRAEAEGILNPTTIETIVTPRATRPAPVAPRPSELETVLAKPEPPGAARPSRLTALDFERQVARLTPDELKRAADAMLAKREGLKPFADPEQEGLYRALVAEMSRRDLMGQVARGEPVRPIDEETARTWQREEPTRTIAPPVEPSELETIIGREPARGLRTRDELELDQLAAEAAKRPPLPTTIGTAPRAGEVGPLPERGITPRDVRIGEEVAAQAAKRPPLEAARGLAPVEAPTPLETMLAPEPPAGGAPLKPNERSFAVQRAGLTREQVETMTPDAVRAHNRDVGEAMRAARAAAPPAAEQPAAAPAPPRRPLPPEVQEYGDLVEATVTNHPERVPEVRNFAERQIEVMRRNAQRRAALDRTAVAVGEEAVTPEGRVETVRQKLEREIPREQVDAAFELLKEADDFEQFLTRPAPGARVESMQAFPEPEQPIRPGQMEQHRQARERAAFIEAASPEALQKYADSLGRLQDREFAIQVRNQWSEAKAAPPPKGEGGEYLGTASGGLAKLADLYKTDPTKFWRIMRLVNGGVGAYIGSDLDENDPRRGAILGALAGVALASPKVFRAATYQQLAKGARAYTRMKAAQKEGVFDVRAWRDPKQGISLIERYFPFSPERIVPDVYKRANSILAELRDLEEYGPLRKGVAPVEARKRAEGRYLRDTVAEIRDMADETREWVKQATTPEQGTRLERRASFLDRLADQVQKKPTLGQLQAKRVAETLGFKDAPYDWVEKTVGTNTYRVLIGWALDTGMQNLTQPIIALRHLTALDVLHGYRGARTPAGKAITKHIEIRRPVDLEMDIQHAQETARTGGFFAKVKAFFVDPMRFISKTDQFNRRVVYLGALRRAKMNGLAGNYAREWAASVMRATQADVGPLSFNPSYRGPFAGSVRPFLKFPGLLVENLLDVFAQPDKAGRNRFILALAGTALAGRAMGIDLEDLLLLGGRPLGLNIFNPVQTVKDFARGDLPSPTFRAAKDVAQHLAGTAKHPFSPDIKYPREWLDSDLAYLLLGRYPIKVAQTTGRTWYSDIKPTLEGRERTPHMRRTPSGTANPVTALEDLLSLGGFKSTRMTEQTRVAERAGEVLRQEETARTAIRAEVNRHIKAAVDRGDWSTVGKELARLQSRTSATSLLKDLDRQRYDKIIRSAPPKVRALLEAEYGERARALQLPR